MSPEQDRLHQIFTEALAKASPEERKGYLAEACGGNAELRCQLDSLLEAHAESDDFLSGNLINGHATSIGEGPGSVVGRYRLLQQIGEGGFGVVFMAEQQEPVRRMVALKILKPGMDTKEVVARFEAGRQALALMDHPNIARVLDGGATESGRPYFVMELVKGAPITEFCDQRQLSIDERLRLFIKVCAGVQHAHQKGIIHRDLKPSNVMVTVHDGEPVPKVIDFGIAKAIGHKLTERTLFTRFEQLLGTPAYMSPEQAEWSGLDIDTRSDLYSLGVLLYELLTGSTPLEKEALARAAVDEVCRMIRETEPPKPSTRLTALAGGNSAISFPRSRLQKVRGDLDWIVMKALEKNRTRRYDTVNGLALDLEHHLNGEPVVACPPSRTYLAGKFFHKHRTGVAALTVVILALAVGLVLALAGFAQARREKRHAEEEFAAAKALSDFLQGDLLWQASTMTTNPDVTLSEVVDRAAARIGDRFTNQPRLNAMMHLTLGGSYLFRERFAAAEAQLQPAVEIYSKVRGSNDLDTLTALNFLVQSKIGQGKFGEAEPLVHHLCEASAQAVGQESEPALDAFFTFAKWLAEQNRYEEAVPIYHDLVERGRRSGRPNVSAMNNLAIACGSLGRGAEADLLYEEIIGICRTNGAPVYNLYKALSNLGYSCIWRRKYKRASEVLKEVVTIDRRILDPQDRRTARDLLWLSHAYGALGSWEACLSACREGLQFTNDLEVWEEFPYQGAVAALLVGDTNAFHEFSGRLLAQNAGTTSADRARMTLEICLLKPDAVPDLTPVFQLVELASSRGDPEGHIARGMTEYRRGHFENALRCLQASRQSTANWAASQAGYFCAMIHFQQGDQAAARADLDDASWRLDAYIRRGFGYSWHEYGRVAVVRAEAERLILGREVSRLVMPQELEAERQRWSPVHERFADGLSLSDLKRWSRAGAEYSAALQDPAFTWETALADECCEPLVIGTTFLLTKDMAGYNRFGQELFSFVERHRDPVLAWDVMEICLASQESDAQGLRRKALTWSLPLEGVADAPPDRVRLVRMLMAYRAERFEEAIERAKAAEMSDNSLVKGAAQLFHAMSLFKLGRTDAGGHSLREAEKLLGPSIGKPLVEMGDRRDFGLCQLALDEAHRLSAEEQPK